ncbi:MAG: hypothetical protein COC24_008115 [Alphaproteobacteria bacterium]|nr:hypothetical protein [Alphaproteobacteria bacterium]
MSNQAFIYIGLGFAAASLLAVLLSQILYRRAYKAADKHIRGQIPINQNELNAARDRLRAEFAVNVNKLEYKVASMQQSQLKLRIEATQADEQKQQIQDQLNSYIKKAVRWETAYENEQNIVNILKTKLKLQSDRIENLQNAELKFKSEFVDVKHLKLEDELETAQIQLKTTEDKLSIVTNQTSLQAIELAEAHKNNLIHQAKISEISTQMLFLSQQLFAKKISLDLSEKAIDKYKNKLLNQKLQMRDASLKDKVIYAVKSKLNGTASLNLTAAYPAPEVEIKQTSATTNQISINPNNIIPPKLVHDANKPHPKAPTGLRGRMNSMINQTSD